MVKVKIQFKNINNIQVIKTRVNYEIGDKPGFKVIKILIVTSGHETKRKCRVTYSMQYLCINNALSLREFISEQRQTM